MVNKPQLFKKKKQKTNVPIEEQSETPKQHGVENMIDDLWLLSYSSFFKAIGFAQWLTAVRENYIKILAKSINIMTA